MKTTDNDRQIRERKEAQWKLHQQLAAFAADLNRLPDAQKAKDDLAKTAPAHLLEMVF